MLLGKFKQLVEFEPIKKKKRKNKSRFEKEKLKPAYFNMQKK